MFPFFQRLGRLSAVIALSLVSLLWGCGPARYAYFPPSTNSIRHTLSTEAFALTDTLPESVINHPVEAKSLSVSPAPQPAMPVAVSMRQSTRHQNPDSYPNQRFSRLFGARMPLEHVAPQTRLIDQHSTNRKTYKLGVVALGAAVLSVGLFFLPITTTLAWALAVSLPLTATLLGVASLTTINRHKDRYRGKGWAMAAILIGTGVLGMALIALAALSMTQIVGER